MGTAEECWRPRDRFKKVKMFTKNPAINYILLIRHAFHLRFGLLLCCFITLLTCEILSYQIYYVHRKHTIQSYIRHICYSTSDHLQSKAR